MSDILKDQALALEIKRLLDLGVKPYEIYDSVSRCRDDVRATDQEVEDLITLTENSDDFVADANPWVSRGEPEGDGEPATVWIHVWLRLGDD